VPKKNSPGCTCCGDCTILEDDFDRADSTNLGADWEERVGDWSISGNAAVCASANSLMITTASNPDALPEGYVAVVVSCNTASDLARVIIGYVDDNNYYFAQARFTATDSFLRVGRNNAGVISYLAAEETLSSGSINDDALLRICYANGVITAQLYDAADPLLASSVAFTTSATLTGLKTGLPLALRQEW
jgi:hypothetical protein